MSRYKNKDWESAYKHSRRVLKASLNGDGLNHLISTEAQSLLKAHYRGPWKMIIAITRRELFSLWLHSGWPKWEWIRVKILRRSQNEVIATAERVWAEEEELIRIAGEI